jgi:hypothetical protein
MSLAEGLSSGSKRRSLLSRSKRAVDSSDDKFTRAFFLADDRSIVPLASLSSF